MVYGIWYIYVCFTMFKGFAFEPKIIFTVEHV